MKQPVGAAGGHEYRLGLHYIKYSRTNVKSGGTADLTVIDQQVRCDDPIQYFTTGVPGRCSQLRL